MSELAEIGGVRIFPAKRRGPKGMVLYDWEALEGSSSFQDPVWAIDIKGEVRVSQLAEGREVKVEYRISHPSSGAVGWSILDMWEKDGLVERLLVKAKAVYNIAAREREASYQMNKEVLRHVARTRATVQ